MKSGNLHMCKVLNPAAKPKDEPIKAAWISGRLLIFSLMHCQGLITVIVFCQNCMYKLFNTLNG